MLQNAIEAQVELNAHAAVLVWQAERAGRPANGFEWAKLGNSVRPHLGLLGVVAAFALGAQAAAADEPGGDAWLLRADRVFDA